MTELRTRDGVGDRSPVRKRTGTMTARALAGLALLPAAYALMLCYTLLSGAYLDEGPWWLLVFGIAAAYGLVAPPALRRWRGTTEESPAAAPTRDRALPDRGRVPAATGGEGGAERQLLETIERHGEITPVKAALETPLTVSEAESLLGELAEGGHLEVHARDGKLFYSF